MLLRSYFSRRLNHLLASIFCFITILISAQFIFEIFHDLNFYYVSFGEIAFFYLKELAVSAPIVLNISFVMGWLLLQNRTAIEQQQHASLMSGWGRREDASMAIEYLCLIGLTNFVLLFYVNPLMNLPLIQKNSSEVEWLSQKNVDKRLELKVGPNQMLIIDGIKHGVVRSPLIVQASDSGWASMSAHEGELNTGAVTLHNGQMSVYSINLPPQVMEFEKISVPFQMPPSKIEWAGLDAHSLCTTTHPRGKAELFWRFFLIAQPWVCILPFYSQKVMLRQKMSMTHSLLEGGLLFGITIVLGFSISKMIFAQAWAKALIGMGLFFLLGVYGFVRAWHRGSYAYN